MKAYTVNNLFFLLFWVITDYYYCSDVPEKQIMFLIKRLECNYSDAYVELVECELKSHPNGSSRAHIGGNLKVKVEQIWLKTRSFPKFNNSLGYIEFVDDLCRVLLQQNGLMIRFLPIFFEIDPILVHPCPYEPGRIVMNEYVEEQYGENAKVAEFFPPTEYDILFRLYDANDETIFEVNVDVEVVAIN